ncbi:PEPxxWA-CTERM sorting domain-containing protein [Azohydromonas sp. G-1-1-14]|uniref:PEPxxWA-CTERM sorting domain-containing protein n=1 Tax=Azohydromonas caseinilytica TaxID=2728836 RepID=A0A848F9D3_9BURK|nr:PEPxxWA-CTERM sorting domain-containing protein [Azohydromonas caseinilytica]
MVSLNDLVLVSPDEQWHLSRATDINERGQIVGSGWHGGSFSAYLLTPVPEPRSWALLLAGLGLVGAVARRRPARGR